MTGILVWIDGKFWRVRHRVNVPCDQCGHYSETSVEGFLLDAIEEI